VTAQAEAVAFIDNFKLMMFVSFLAIPLVVLVRVRADPLATKVQLRLTEHRIWRHRPSFATIFARGGEAPMSIKMS